MPELINAVLKHIESEEAYILTKDTANWNKYNAVATIEHLSFVVSDNDELEQVRELLEDEGKHLENRTFREPIVGLNQLTGKVYKYLYLSNQ